MQGNLDQRLYLKYLIALEQSREELASGAASGGSKWIVSDEVVADFRGKFGEFIVRSLPLWNMDARTLVKNPVLKEKRISTITQADRELKTLKKKNHHARCLFYRIMEKLLKKPQGTIRKLVCHFPQYPRARATMVRKTSGVGG